MEPEAQQPAPQDVADDVDSLQQALAQEREKAEQYLAGWQRAQADYQNLKRRTEQEKEEAVRFANAMLILSMLPVLDDMERAFATISAELAGLTWVDGIRLIHRKLRAALEVSGLSDIQAVGEPFDPNLHEAVVHQDGEEGIVLSELQKGYKLNDRVIRPTMVVVGRGGSSTSENPESSTSQGG
ncbi:MAG: nucleotide exchange factor GrpE [Dehalococcoidia bacterium]|jgi:molecular chaperone GrpE|nr:nucleotide exchange factor GrpE [Dehalococcoidia bacterium]MDP6510201.1 nucleotide exchange factor GrpE [Dehalococcoidia bacterium]MDP6783379.1 nucleotide exchange factor GrpE [Dehalococcoidia bacterium]|tara:strand:+ start:182 stop:733 length:552 start_codon:yes stop_codon:yes gene_type:complete